MKKKEEKISCYGSLETLIQDLESRGITRKDFDKIDFELDWTGCYYEGDWPSITARIRVK